MKKLIRKILYRLAMLTGWRWMALVAGVAMLTACSGKSDKKSNDKDSIPDSMQVTCYEPVADTTVKSRESSDTAAMKDVSVVNDTDARKVPLHPCYVPVKPKE